jgi:osmotically inducible protein OsmC
MALSAMAGSGGHVPARIHTVAKVHLGMSPAGPTITRIDLETEAEIPELGPEEFQRLAQSAKATCLVSRALAGVADIRLKAELIAAAAAVKSTH